MAYVLLDDQIAAHPKILRAGAEAAWLWAVSIAYCNRQLTDGYVPAAALSTLGTFRTPTKRLAATLVTVGLFDVDGDDYRVHDYLKHNPDKATVQERMHAAAERKAAYRARKSHRDTPGPGRRRDASVPPLSHGDTHGTGASSRAYVPTPTPTPTPTPLPTDTESVSVGALAPAPTSVVPFDHTWGASPTRRFSAKFAWQGQRAGLGVMHDQHEELLSKMATPDEPGLLAWYAETERAWQGRGIGESCYHFWNKRFEEWQGSTAKAKAEPVMSDAEAYAAVAEGFARADAKRKALREFQAGGRR